MGGQGILANLNDVMIICAQVYTMSEVSKAEQSTINTALDSLAQPTGALQEADEEPELQGMIEKFREEEREHHDAAIAAGAEQAPAYPLLSAAIRLGCRAAIRLSERV